MWFSEGTIYSRHSLHIISAPKPETIPLTTYLREQCSLICGPGQFFFKKTLYVLPYNSCADPLDDQNKQEKRDRLFGVTQGRKWYETFPNTEKRVELKCNAKRSIFDELRVDGLEIW